MDGQFNMIDFLKDKFNVVALYLHIEEFFMPPRDTGIEVGRFFRRHAFDKDFKVHLYFPILLVNCTFVTNLAFHSSRNVKKQGMTFMARLRNTDVWGGQYFLTMMVKLAKREKFTNPTRCTGQGK